jgi:hypothetical protein
MYVPVFPRRLEINDVHALIACTHYISSRYRKEQKEKKYSDAIVIVCIYSYSALIMIN